MSEEHNCIFCKLMSGEIPTSTLYEDDEFKVILDVNPASKGHALVVPKKHYRDVFDIEDEVLARAYKLAKKTADKLMERLDATGINILQNNGADAGQSVFHFHIHVIPRYESDFIGLTWKPTSLADNVKNSLINLW